MYIFDFVLEPYFETYFGILNPLLKIMNTNLAQNLRRVVTKLTRASIKLTFLLGPLKTSLSMKIILIHVQKTTERSTNQINL